MSTQVRSAEAHLKIAAYKSLAMMMFLAAGGVWLKPAPASASLGRAYDSVDVDRLMLGAKINSTAAGAYTVHVLTLPNQGTIKEFTRADGKVFAVLWRAPGRPDLRQILGDNYDAVQADNAARVGRRVRLPISVNRPGLVVQSGGHSGAFWGSAVMPQLQPAGFSASDLK